MPTVSNSKAFTLFELLIVVLLISVLYGIFVHKLTRAPQAKTDQLTLMNLKSFLLKIPFKRKIEVLCLEPCKECNIYIDGKKAKSDSFSLFKSIPNIYSLDKFGQARTISFLPLIDKNGAMNNVCFKYSLLNNKSSSYYALEDDGKYYLFDPYMKDVKMTKSFSDVSLFFDDSKLLPSDRRDYEH
jgi:prepilin-type N-terminal cleavage/methylation domain-containing protein